jgi:acetyl esterase/lipase
MQLKIVASTGTFKNIIVNLPLLALAGVLLASCSSHQGHNGSDIELPDTGYHVSDKERYSPEDWPQPLHAQVYTPKGPGLHPAVLVVHGGGWQRRSPEDMDAIARHLAGHGFVAINVEHRFAPEYRFPAQLHDLQQAMHWIHANAKRLQVDPERVGALGFSSGAHLVSLMALVAGQGGELDQPYGGILTRPAAVVSGGTPSDLRKWEDGRLVEQFTGGTQAEIPDTYAQASPVYHVHSEAPPFFLFHGTWDMLVPTNHAIDFYDELKSAGVPAELYLQKLRGHFTSFVFRQGAIGEGTEFLHRHLK